MSSKTEETKEKKPFKVILFIVLLGVVALTGWGVFEYGANAAEGHGAEGGQGAPQAMPVPVTIVKKDEVQIWKEFSGRLSAVNSAEIRPQVSGTITEVKFEDGQNVKKDDVLLVIDPRPFEAAVKKAEADYNAAKNRSNLAWTDLKRAKDLIKKDAISQRILDERSNTFMLEKAAIEAAEAAVEQAKINLDYTTVKAPFDGQVSQVEVTEGNLVQAGPNAPVLTTLISNDEIYADFEVDEQTYIQFIRGQSGDDQKIPVRMSLSADDKVYEGHIHSFDNRIDAASGTIRARALFENEDGSLLPGMYAAVRIGSPAKQEKVLISDRAIGTNQDRKFVYVIGDDGMSAYREVTLGENLRGKTEVLEGLEEGEVVISDGIIRIRPGMPVTPQEQSSASENQMPKSENE